MLRSPLRSIFVPVLGSLALTPVQRAIAFLRSLGTNAHVWLPGANGVSVASLPSNNYLLSDGSTGYSTVDGVDGLTLDGMGALGSELVTNGDFSNGTTGWGWYVSFPPQTFTNVAGELHVVNDGVARALFGQSTSESMTAGETYRIQLSVRLASGALPGIALSAAFYSATLVTLQASGPTGLTTYTYDIYYKAVSTGAVHISFDSYAAFDIYVDTASIKPYTGIHLTQPTTANKPLVRRGMLGLMTYSNDLTNAAWLDYRSCTVSGQAIVEAAATASHFVQRVTAVTITSGVVYTTAYLVKANGRNFFAAIGDSAVGFLAAPCRWNVSTGANTVTGAGCTVSSADAGSGYWLCTITATATGVTARPAVGPCLDGTTSPASFQSYLGDGASGVLVAAVGVMAGSWTADQILAEGGIPTTTATAASNPSAGKYWWSFDGSNDSLLSGNLGITNACTIVIAGRVNSLSAINYLLGEATNGVQVYININGSLSFGKVAIADILVSSAGQIVTGVPFVITVRLSGGTAVFRLNGVQIATAATAYTFSATTGMRIGMNFGASVYPFNGALGWVVPLPVALSDADCLTVERLVGQQFPGMATF